MTRELLERTSTIAVVGLSTSPFKDAHRIPAMMQMLGYHVVGVHPTADELLGEPAYRTLRDIPFAVDMVNVFRPADEAADIALEAVEIGAKSFWLQLGLRSPDARRIVTGAGLEYVEDRCIAVEARMHGIRKSA